MKKTAISIIILLAFAISAYAQGYKDKKPIRLGLKASPNVGWIRPETRNFENDGVRLGFSYGLIADFIITENYYVGTGLFITHYNAKMNMPAIEDVEGLEDWEGWEDLEDVTQSRQFNLQYLEIPLTLKLLTNEIGYITYFGQFGIGLGANISAKGEDTYTASDDSIVDEDPDIKSDITFLRAALVIGGGLEYSLAQNASIVIGGEYNNGFTNLLKDKPEHDKKHSALTNYFQLTIGIVF